MQVASYCHLLEVQSDCRYGLLNAMSAGKSVDIDVGFDHHGKCTTDPAEILKGGALRNFSRSACRSLCNSPTEALISNSESWSEKSKLTPLNAFLITNVDLRAGFRPWKFLWLCI